jgi:acyl-CoA thioester hydrolase
MRVVYYGKFFEYFEQGRADLLRNVGLPYGELEGMGFHLPVIEAHAEYRRPARYDELLTVVTMLRRSAFARVRLEYEVIKQDETGPLVTGYTVHAFVDAATGRPTRAPARFLEIIGSRINNESAT